VDKIVPLWVSNEIAVRATPAVIGYLSTLPEVAAVEPVQSVADPANRVAGAAASTMPANLSTINASALWDLGFRGQGVVVANMDTGVDVTHPDLATNWRGGSNSWYDPNGQHPTTPTDVSGHGTWTMGAMVGGSTSGTPIGVAPDAKWIAAKIFNDRGVATTTGIHQAFQWLLDPDGNPATADAPDVVNESWTMSGLACDLEFQPDLRSLRAANILPVFAAGNDGPAANTVFSPADNPEAFSVGGTDVSDALDPYSSRGPSTCGAQQSPNLTAPDTNIVSTDLYGGYATGTGTSLAAPQVAGTLALLESAYGVLPVGQQEAALQSGAHDLGPSGPDPGFGYGRLDALASYNWLAATPDFTIAAAPQSLTVPVGGGAATTVSTTALRGFSGDVALTLAGLPAGAQATFAPTAIAGGSGSAQASVTTSSALAPGTYPLTVTGTGGGTSHSVAVTLVVQGPPDFTVSVAPADQQVVAGGSVSYTVAVSTLNGFTADVSLTAAGVPSSVGSATVSPALLHGAGAAVVTVGTSTTAPPGTYPLTVTASSGGIAHTASANVVVTAPADFTLTATPQSRTVARGSATTYSLGVGAQNGFARTVALAVSGLPASVGSASFAPASVTGSGSTQLTVSVASGAPTGSYRLTVTGSAQGLVHTAPVTLVVTAPDFAVTATPASVSVTRGQSASYTVSVTGSGGFLANVSLAVSGLPAGSTATFSVQKLPPGRSTTLRITTSGSTPRATYALTVSGTANGTTHAARVSLTVR
jgi:subtilisin family serine protease